VASVVELEELTVELVDDWLLELEVVEDMTLDEEVVEVETGPVF